MDLTLRELLIHTDEIHQRLDKMCMWMPVSEIDKYVIELQSRIKTIQTVALQMANVANIAHKISSKRRQRGVKDFLAQSSGSQPTSQTQPIGPPPIGPQPTGVKQSDSDKKPKYINPLPHQSDIGTLRTMAAMEHKEIVPGVEIPVKYVDTPQEVPQQHMYFVRTTGQFVMNISGISLSGDLGNMVDYQDKYSSRCEYGVHCKSFLPSGKPCNYYHDPADFIKHGKEPLHVVRNFTVGSWIYSRCKNPRTYFTRHIGSRDRLVQDLKDLRKVQYHEEIHNREGQLIHDVLIYLILNAKNMIDKHKQWSYS